MYFSNNVNNKKKYEISLNIRAFQEITEKDKKRVNKVALLLGSLGENKNLTEKEYRFRMDMGKEELLLDIEDYSDK